MAFHIGQEVECIAEFPDEPNTPKKGEVYKVRGVAFAPILFGLVRIETLLLEEIVDVCKNCGEEHGWASFAFRPLTQQRLAIIESLKAQPPDNLAVELEPLTPQEVAFQ